LPRKTDSKNPADWLLISESDLSGIAALAKQELAYDMVRSKLAEVLEKILKAELLRLGWALVKTHDVLVLAKELEVRGSDLMSDVKPLAIALAGTYFIARYPGFDLEDPDWPEFRAKLAQAEKLLITVKARLPQPKS